MCPVILESDPPHLKMIGVEKSMIWLRVGRFWVQLKFEFMDGCEMTHIAFRSTFYRSSVKFHGHTGWDLDLVSDKKNSAGYYLARNTTTMTRLVLNGLMFLTIATVMEDIMGQEWPWQKALYVYTQLFSTSDIVALIGLLFGQLR